MSSSPPQSSSSASPGDLPQRIFDVDCYPGHVVRINSYSRPRYLVDILDILAGLPELQTLLASPLGKLFSLHVRYCSLSGQLVHQMLCRQLCTPHSDALCFVYGGQPLRFSLVEFEQLTGLSCASSPPTTDILAAFVVFTVVSVALATAPQPPIPAPNRPLLDNPTSLLAGNSVRLRPSRVVLSVFLSVFLSGLCEGTNSML
ncbi:uncharacterized protein LOC111829561 isoform X1 [Capsella rubella]|uniref:uncharacterized protein LOC111829561 isoform X1 n=1 Tax=Capsella rubella TaxID=81985 RepID=UPI000CD532B9|nr:uncharacterized protein LOC111829561 isoform X1 [Capsella rubella]XP_023634653.1 uncharacterized protein LOC111829561 isoform X1 [Capsella rubella]